MKYTKTSSTRRVLHVRMLLNAALFLLLVSSGSALSFENEECMGCHGSRDILQLSAEERREMVIPAPERKEVPKGTLTLYVDMDIFRDSVHGEMSCVDCHSDIEDIPHKQRLGLVNCGACHEEIVQHYAGSKHAEVSDRLCFECHNPHATTSFKKLTQRERIGICQQCHKTFGHEWLPAPDEHLRSLECTVCHAAKAEKGLFFQVTAERKDGTRSPLSYEEMKDSGVDMSDLAKVVDMNGNGTVEVNEITEFLTALRAKGVRSPRLQEQVLVIKPFHNYTDEVKHVKDCTMCHVSAAPFYTQVMIRLPASEDGFLSLPAEKALLEKFPPVPAKDQYYETVHGKSGIECVECHADIAMVWEAGELKVQATGTPVCEHCHEEVMAEYRGSLHARVSQEICFGCHDPHSTVPFRELSAEQRKTICTKCHDALKGHEWLPQKEAHFRHLECTMCHAPKAERGIIYFLERVDEAGDHRKLTHRDLATMLGEDEVDLAKLLDGDGNGVVESRELTSFLGYVAERSGQRLELGVRVLVLRASHNYTDKGSDVKDCSRCHSAQADFYDKLRMEIPEPGGGIRTLPLDKSILATVRTVPVTKDFYVLGEGKISRKDLLELKDVVLERGVGEFMYVVRKIGYKWLDVIGIFFLLGGIGFVILHGSLRFLSRGLRRRRLQVDETGSVIRAFAERKKKEESQEEERES